MADVYLLTLALALGIAVLATIGLQALSSRRRWQRLFYARGPRERPRWGGVAIFLSFALTPFVASALSGHAAELFEPRSGDFLGFLFAAFMILLVGMFDDLRVATPLQKLAVQVAAGAAVYAAGYSIERVGLPWGPELALGWVAAPVTVIWIVFFTNAVNLIDGRDGVALGVAVLAAVTLAAIGGHAHHPTVALLLVAIAGAGLGFLPWNLPPASLYIGDSGALLLGFLLGSLGIRATTGPTDAVFVAVTVIALGFPLLDAALAAVRRLLDRRHPFGRDEDHIHDRLEAYGFGPRGLLVVIWGLSVLFSGAALLLHYIDWFVSEAMVLLGFIVVVTLVLSRLGYVVTLWNSHSVVWLRRRLIPDAGRSASDPPARRDHPA